MTSPAAEPRRPNPIMTWAFAIIMVVLTGVFIWLGTWQMERLGEKEALVAAVAQRIDTPAVPLPAQAEWAGFDANAHNFEAVSLTGSFRHDQAIAIFTSLVDGNGPASGPGYWIVTPFALEDGGSVFVNRGFVPQAVQPDFMNDPDGPQGVVTITGMLRPPEHAGAFVPEANAADRIDWVRDPQRLGALVDPALAPFAPFYVDLPAGPAGTLPQGGETVISFPNNHLGYAMTWYGFAIITPIMLAVWLRRQRRPRR